MANSLIVARANHQRRPTARRSPSLPSPFDTTTSWFRRSLLCSRSKTRLRGRDEVGILRQDSRYDDGAWNPDLTRPCEPTKR
jgi:hypothetical protein